MTLTPDGIWWTNEEKLNFHLRENSVGEKKYYEKGKKELNFMCRKLPKQLNLDWFSFLIGLMFIKPTWMKTNKFQCLPHNPGPGNQILHWFWSAACVCPGWDWCFSHGALWWWSASGDHPKGCLSSRMCGHK